VNSKKGLKKMENAAQNTKQNYLQQKRKFELEMENAISINGGIELITPDGDLLTDILLAEPKGLYAVDENELLKIEAIFQSIQNGSVLAHIKEYGLMHFEFDFVGSKSACYKYLYEQGQEQNINCIRVDKR
jgi:hypothetical protein